jgi:GT2 family glycosyltransferase/CelD/BcsL family acetyltransferase involved in cellulose biosynthesis
MTAVTARVTAVIVTYQSRHTIGVALNALQAAHAAGLVNAVVVDNASTDGTADVVAEHYPWVALVRHDENIGYGRGCNRGFKQIDTPYVLFLNPDAVIDYDALQALVSFLDRTPKAGIVAPAIIEGHRDVHQAAGLMTTPGTVLRAALGGARPYPARRAIEPGGPPFATNWLCGAVMLVRSDLFRSLGGFDPGFFLYFEETDLCRRAARQGAELWAVGHAIARHVGGASAKATTEQLRSTCVAAHYHRSRCYYLVKHFGWFRAIGTEAIVAIVQFFRRLRHCVETFRRTLCRGARPTVASTLRRIPRRLMKYNVIQAREVTADLTRRWAKIQTAAPSLASPYFRPEFTEAVAAVRDDVFVALLEDSGRVVGFFPFHRRRGGMARPIGLGLSDYHGVIAEAGADWTVEALLRGCGLSRYEFDHLPLDQQPFAGCHRSVEHSPTLDLSQGYEGFEATRDKAGRKQLREIDRKLAKIDSDIGPVAFVCHSSSEDVRRTLMDWKSHQCRETGTIDYFALAWCRQLIQRIHQTRTPEFAGMLSCLYAGKTLAAAHFVMRSSRVWHSWFPVYNHQLEAYSPGLILLVQMIRSAAKEPVAYIDFGRGVSTYKKRFMTGTIPVAQGHAEVPSLLNSARRLRDSAERWSRASVLRPVLRLPGRVLKSIERQMQYE